LAYIPPLGDPNKNPYLLASGSSGGAPGIASGSAPSSPPPASDGGQRFGALRSFFAANQPTADAQIGTVTQPIEERANEAVDLAAQAKGQTAAQGGADTAGRALTARDDALGMLDDTESQGGLAGLLGEGKDATYTEGQRNADAYLYGRAPGMEGFREKWGGVLGALNPAYKPDPVPKESAPPVLPKGKNPDPRGKYPPNDFDEEYDPRRAGRPREM
jgi:hypothetical protein